MNSADGQGAPPARGAAAWPAWIGLRYLRARKGNRFVGFISVIAMAGIALGVAVLITVLSVMNGFERDLSRRILDIVSHATLEGMDGRLADWRGIAELTRTRTRGGRGRALSSRAGPCSSRGERSAAVDLRAVLPEDESAGVGARVACLRRAVSTSWRRAAGASCWAAAWRESSGVRRGDTVLVVIAAGQRDAGRRHAAHAPLHGRRHSRCRHVRVRPGPRAHAHGRRARAVSPRRRRHRPALPLRRPARGRGARFAPSGRCSPDAYYINDWSRRQGNFFRSLQVTKIHHVLRAAAGRRRRRLQHRLRRSSWS